MIKVIIHNKEPMITGFWWAYTLQSLFIPYNWYLYIYTYKNEYHIRPK